MSDIRRYTILGAGGSIGNPLAEKLLADGCEVRLISRSGFSWPGAESVKADLTDQAQTIEAVKGSDVVFLTAGFKYDLAVWKVVWPKAMTNTIEACKRANAKLIFFDNVYMYGRVEGKMTEDSPYNPVSRKGEVRAGIARQLEREWQQGNLRGMIARSADLYGPYSLKSSMMHILVIDKLMNGKGAQWPVDAEKNHSFTYTIDCANALALLSANDDALNQIWHLPTANPAPTGKGFIDLVARELNVRPKYMVLKPWMFRLLGLMVKDVAELYEMLYQYRYEYYFDSSKFEKRFSVRSTGYERGIKETINFLKSRNSK